MKTDQEVCVWCYIERDTLVYNVNGRCDHCGGTSFEVPETIKSEDYLNDY